MSRSTKDTDATVRVQRYYPVPTQPGTEKAGARRRPNRRPRSSQQNGAVRSRHGFGRTEKILRRNRKLWTRLYAKIGRRLDKRAVQESAAS